MLLSIEDCGRPDGYDKKDMSEPDPTENSHAASSMPPVEHSHPATGLSSFQVGEVFEISGTIYQVKRVGEKSVVLCKTRESRKLDLTGDDFVTLRDMRFRITPSIMDRIVLTLAPKKK